MAQEQAIWSRPSVGPILVTLVLAAGVQLLSADLALLTGRALGLPLHFGAGLSWLYVQHGYQLLLALVAIALLKRIVRADFGLHPPRGKTYYGAAVVWGVVFAALGYAPGLLAGRAPTVDYPLNAQNLFGWLFFEGVYVGPTEEIPFRALLVTYLAAHMRGRLRLGRFDMNWAGVIVAALFALSHAYSFTSEPWPLALFQQVYAFALGVLYAYWLEKSGSVWAPTLGHNVSDGLTYVIMYSWIAVGR